MADGPKSSEINITGGAGEYEAAAIIVVFQHLVEEAAAARAVLPRRRRPSAWTQAYQDPHPDDPITKRAPESRNRPAPS